MVAVAAVLFQAFYRFKSLKRCAKYLHTKTPQCILTVFTHLYNSLHFVQQCLAPQQYVSCWLRFIALQTFLSSEKAPGGQIRCGPVGRQTAAQESCSNHFRMLLSVGLVVAVATVSFFQFSQTGLLQCLVLLWSGRLPYREPLCTVILAGRVGDTSQLATYQTDLATGLTPGLTRFGLVWLSILSVHPMLASLAMLSLAEHSMRQHAIWQKSRSTNRNRLLSTSVHGDSCGPCRWHITACYLPDRSSHWFNTWIHAVWIGLAFHLVRASNACQSRYAVSCGTQHEAARNLAEIAVNEQEPLVEHFCARWFLRAVSVTHHSLLPTRQI